MVRPADANETAAAWLAILRNARPAGLALSRQNLPIVDRSELGSVDGVAKGGYVLADAATAVSYTHLDVYKRQVLAAPGSGLIRSFAHASGAPPGADSRP